MLVVFLVGDIFIIKSRYVAGNDGTAHTMRCKNNFLPSVCLDKLFEKFGISAVIHTPVVIEYRYVPVVSVFCLKVETLLTVSGNRAVLYFFAVGIRTVSAERLVVFIPVGRGIIAVGGCRQDVCGTKSRIVYADALFVQSNLP